LALRQRLNETTDELEKLKREATEQAVRLEYLNKELTVAKSDREFYRRQPMRT
jgi:protein HOOK3